jgi:hypothetical protein
MLPDNRTEARRLGPPCTGPRKAAGRFTRTGQASRPGVRPRRAGRARLRGARRAGSAGVGRPLSGRTFPPAGGGSLPQPRPPHLPGTCWRTPILHRARHRLLLSGSTTGRVLPYAGFGWSTATPSKTSVPNLSGLVARVAGRCGAGERSRRSPARTTGSRPFIRSGASTALVAWRRSGKPSSALGAWCHARRLRLRPDRSESDGRTVPIHTITSDEES